MADKAGKLLDLWSRSPPTDAPILDVVGVASACFSEESIRLYKDVGPRKATHTNGGSSHFLIIEDALLRDAASRGEISLPGGVIAVPEVRGRVVRRGYRSRLSRAAMKRRDLETTADKEVKDEKA